MKNCSTFFLILVAGTLLADQPEAPELPQGNSPEAIAARKEFFMSKTGGFIEVGGTGPAIHILDLRESPGAAPKKVAETIGRAYRLPITNSVGSLSKDSRIFNMVMDTRQKTKALMVVAVAVEESEKPALTVFPEERVAIVNVGKLGFDGTNGEALEIRVVKEIWRAIGFIGGTGYANHAKSVMQPVSSPIELDVNSFQVMQPTEIQRMQPMLGKYGVKPGHRTIYRKAVADGWAPPPTNDYQRAVWDRVMAEKAAAVTNATSKALAPAK